MDRRAPATVEERTRLEQFTRIYLRTAIASSILAVLFEFTIGGGIRPATLGPMTITSCPAGPINRSVILGKDLVSTGADCITVGVDNVFVDGGQNTDGTPKYSIAVPSGKNAITVDGKKGITIRNVRSSTGTLSAKRTDRLLVTKSSFTGSQGSVAFFFHDNINAAVTNNTFRSLNSSAMELTSPSLLATNNSFKNNVFWSSDRTAGVVIASNNGTIFDHNTFHNADNGAAMEWNYTKPVADFFRSNIYSFAGPTAIRVNSDYAYTRADSNYNVFYSRSGDIRFAPSNNNLTQWRAFSAGAGSSDEIASYQALNTLPVFINAAAGDFHLPENSQARLYGEQGTDVGAFPFVLGLSAGCTACGNEMIPPVATITSPSSLSTGSGTIAVKVAATDDTAVARLELYNNGLLVPTITIGSASPYTVLWDSTPATATVATLTVKVYDLANNVVTTPAVTVTIGASVAGNTTIANDVVIDPPTLISAGLAWNISQDGDQDASATVKYREYGTNAWKDAQPLLRVDNKPIDGINPGNLFAGSIFNLKADTTYRVLLTLQDPDGGLAQTSVAVRTRPVPAAMVNAPTRYVIPGSGGGTGTIDDPFKGVTAADAAARPGDVFVLEPGTYTGAVTFTKDGAADAPIVYRGADVATVYIDGGNGTTSFLFDLSNRKNIIVEKMTFQRSKFHVRGKDTQNVAFQNNVVKDVVRGTSGSSSKAILFDGNSKNDYLCNNIGRGPEPYADRSILNASYGFHTAGSGNVICNNDIRGFWDNIGFVCDLQNFCLSNDVYGNITLDATDDNIEADAQLRNTRVFNNKMSGALSMLSAQPTYGGPLYFVRNEMYNAFSSGTTEGASYKLNATTCGATCDGPSGVIMLQNSSALALRGWKGGNWSNLKTRNNLIYGGASYTIDTVGTTPDMDYDGLSKSDPTYAIKYGPTSTQTRYNTVNASCDLAPVGSADFCFATKQERHATPLLLSHWQNVPAPTGGAMHAWPEACTAPGAPANCTNWDFTPAVGSPQIDSAEVLANINDNFVGAGPDRGAIERGAPAPVYGVTSAVCTPNWVTSAWSACDGTTQTRTVLDTNSCSVTTSQPAASQSCAPPDTIAPTVNILAPVADATVSGSVVLLAYPSDNVGVAGVQFKVDGALVGSEDTVSPYSVTWKTTSLIAGSAHTVLAVARDTAGNSAASAPVAVIIAQPIAGCAADSLPLTAVPVTLNQAGKTYCVTGAVSGTGTITIGADNITLDGQNNVTDIAGSVALTGRKNVVIKNLNITGGVSIVNGDHNQVLSSFFKDAVIQHSSSNQLIGNTIQVPPDGGGAIQIGDINQISSSENTDHNLIQGNHIFCEGCKNSRFIYVTHVTTLTFRDNDIHLTNAYNGAGDTSIMMAIYYTHHSVISGNTMDMTVRSGMTSVGFFLRDQSAYNLIENNTIHGVDRVMALSSGNEVGSARENMFRGNKVYARDIALHAQSMDGSTTFDHNLFYSSQGVAGFISGVGAGSTLRLTNNTFVSLGSNALWSDGNSTERSLYLRNNILYTRSSPTVSIGTFAIDSDYNDFYCESCSSVIIYNGANYSLASWKAPKRDTASLNLDPEFTNVGTQDFTLKTTSAIRDKGLWEDMGFAPLTIRSPFSITGCQSLPRVGDPLGSKYVLTAPILSYSGTCFPITNNYVTLDGNGQTVSGSGDLAAISGYSYNTIRNFNAPQSGVTVNLFFKTNAAGKFDAAAAGSRAAADYNTISDNIDLNSIYIERADNTTVANNLHLGSIRVQNVAIDNYIAPYFAANGTRVVNNTVASNVLKLAWFAGYDETQPDGTSVLCARNTRYDIEDNTFRSTWNATGDEPLVLTMRCAWGTATARNIVRNNIFEATGNAVGLYIRDEANYLDFTGNQVHTNGGWGAFMSSDGNLDKGEPSNNNFRDNQFVADNARAHWMLMTGQNNLFEHNVFWSNGGETAWVSAGGNNTYNHNTFYNKGTSSLITFDGLSGPANTYKNNLFVGYAPKLFQFDHAPDFTGYVAHHNLYSNPSGSALFTNPAAVSGPGVSLGEWKTISGEQASSLEGPAGLIDPNNGNMNINDTSAGKAKADDPVTYGGQVYQKDIGACQVSATGPANFPYRFTHSVACLPISTLAGSAPAPVAIKKPDPVSSLGE